MKNPTGMCLCGCGKPAPLSSESRRGYKRGQPLMYIKGHSSRRRGPEYQVDANGCWIWIGPLSTFGYGRKTVDGRTEGAHRTYYRETHGDVPKGHDVHHRCGVRACVNPNHLVALSRWEHMRVEDRKPYGNPNAWLAA